MNSLYDLGATIKELRKKQKLTQKELANKLNVSEASMSKYEANTATPQFETLRSLAVIFNVSMDTLCGTPQSGMLSIHGLSEEQIKIVGELIDKLRTHNLTAKHTIVPEEYTLIGQIVAAFAK